MRASCNGWNPPCPRRYVSVLRAFTADSTICAPACHQTQYVSIETQSDVAAPHHVVRVSRFDASILLHLPRQFYSAGEPSELPSARATFRESAQSTHPEFVAPSSAPGLPPIRTARSQSLGLTITLSPPPLSTDRSSVSPLNSPTVMCRSSPSHGICLHSRGFLCLAYVVKVLFSIADSVSAEFLLFSLPLFFFFAELY